MSNYISKVRGGKRNINLGFPRVTAGRESVHEVDYHAR